MTNKIVLRTIEEFKTGYTPAYAPLLPLFLTGARKYEVEVGQVKFTTVEAVGDLRAKMYGPKDTDKHQIAAGPGSKAFNRYFFGAQFKQSNLQSRQGFEDVLAQALDENNKFADELLMTAEGTSNGTVKNNGLFYSQDSNYTTKTSVEVDNAGGHLPGLYNLVQSVLEEADATDGEKLVLLYGSTLSSKVNGLFANTDKPFLSVMYEGAPNANFTKVSSAIVPANENGLIVVNMNQIQLHYTTLPDIRSQGVNEEHEYAWANLIVGSSMMEVKAKNGIIRQPITFEA